MSTGPAPQLFSMWPGTARAATGFNDEPPDVHGAVGPAGVLQVVNTLAAYYTRNGTLLWRAGLNDPTGIFQLVASYGGVDPKAVFDPETGRFYVSMVETYDSPVRSYLDLAVSKSSNPLSSSPDDWYAYRIDLKETIGAYSYGGDYPCLGFDGQAIYVTCNMLTLPIGAFSSFRNCEVLAFDKSKAMAGVAAFTRVHTPTGLSAGFTLQPATVVGGTNPGNTAYFGELSYMYSTTSARLWALTDPLTAPVLTSTLITIPNHGGSITGAPQPFPAKPIDTQSARAQGNAFWYAGALWCCHTAGGSAGRAIVRYYKFATNGFPSGTPALVESGSFDGGPGVWNYQPSIGGNARGEVGLVFTRSSSALNPTIMTTARSADADAFPTPIPVLTSPVPYDGPASILRWGDYSVVAVDPADSTFWVSHEFSHIREQDGLVEWATEWSNVVLPAYPSGWTLAGVPLRKAASGSYAPAVASDGGTGAYVAWSDGRNSLATVYVTRVTGAGTIATGWPRSGLSAGVPDFLDAAHIRIVLDGSGGAFVIWAAGRVHVQHVSSTGGIAPGWPLEGVLLTTRAVTAAVPAAIADGAGGVFVAWSQGGTWLQHVSASGALLWGSTGISVSSSGNGPDLIPDGAGGALVTWNPGVRVQRLDAGGGILWTAGGISLGSGGNARIAADGTGGAIIAFQKTGNGADIYAAHVTATGDLAGGWPAGGIAVCAAAGDQVGPRAVADDAGGMVVAWVDYRNDPDDLSGDIRAQRITGAGVPPPGWTGDGVAVVTASGDQSAPGVVADSTGGAIITWQDARADGDVYAQHLTARGSIDPTFGVDGALVCGAAGQQNLPAIATTGRGTAIIAWEDGRDYADCNPICTTAIYAQTLGFDATAPAGVNDLSAAAGRNSGVLRWTITGDDGLSGVADHFDVRYSTAVITAENFDLAIPLGSRDPVGAPGGTTCLQADLGTCSTYFFAMKTVDEAGNESPISNVASASTMCGGNVEATCGGAEVGVGPFDLGDNEPGGIPRSYRLSRPRPNPARDGCRFAIGVPQDGAHQTLIVEVFDLSGRRVASLVHETLRPGWNSAQWNLSSAAGHRVRAGLYYLRLSAGAVRIVRPVRVSP